MWSSTMSRLPPTVRRILVCWNPWTPQWRFRLPFASSRTTRPDPLRRPLVACLALLVLVVVQVAWPAGETPPAPAPTRPLPTAEPTATTQDWPAIAERPLFAPDRRPGRKRDSGPSSLDGLTVLGIAVADRTASAVLRDSTGKVARLRPGQFLGEWSLSAIEPLRLVFEKNGETRAFPFEAKKLRPQSERPAPRVKS